jgi:predicted transcriptional regulator
MRVAKGKVVAGKVVVEGAPLEEGAAVTVLAPEDAETFELGPAEEAELLAAIADAERGDLVEGSDVIAKLSSRD